MDYYEFVFKLQTEEEYKKDLLLQSLAEAGFDSFEDNEGGFKAYIMQSAYDESLLNEVLTPYLTMMDLSYEKLVVENKNWNEVWESNFNPIQIDDSCYIRATFHEGRPEFPYEIIIDPKMSFGTGHHQTTSMMLSFLLRDGAEQKAVLDMGCGTAIIAILARKLGASRVLAIDYDQVCYDSAVENAALNNVDLEVRCGSSEAIPEEHFDIIYANINRNILLDQLERYAGASKPGTLLYLSGFYSEDIPVLAEKARRYGFVMQEEKALDNWRALKLLKSY